MSAVESDPAFIERLRRSGIRIDRDGQFWHEGETVRHEGLRRALFRWLDRLPRPDGRYVLRLDEHRHAYVDVEDTPLVARALRWQEDQPLLALSDGNEEPLDVSTLTIDPAGVLRCLVRRGRLEARLATAATSALADHFGEANGQIRLTIGGRTFDIPARTPRT